VNAPEPRIADALREIAAEAPAPRPLADAAWQAGRRRRRRRGLAAAVTAGAGAIAAVIALIVIATGSPGETSGPPTLAAGPVTLTTPIQFRQVASISGHACRAGSPGLPGPPNIPVGSNPSGTNTCYRFTSKMMTVTRLKAAWVAKDPGNKGYLLAFDFLPGDATRFAALTGKLVGLPLPHCQLAVIVGGRIISAPSVDAVVNPRGGAQIVGFSSRAQVENLLGRG
jgi:hypothetical protein